MYNTYILSYDPIASNYTLNQLNGFIRANAYTYQYYAPVLGTCLIKSSATITEMVDAYRYFFDGSNFFIAQLFPTLTGGALPQSMWDWMNSPSPPPLVQTDAPKN
jgi:hypothetical protein